MEEFNKRKNMKGPRTSSKMINIEATSAGLSRLFRHVQYHKCLLPDPSFRRHVGPSQGNTHEGYGIKHSEL